MREWAFFPLEYYIVFNGYANDLCNRDRTYACERCTFENPFGTVVSINTRRSLSPPFLRCLFLSLFDFRTYL